MKKLLLLLLLLAAPAHAQNISIPGHWNSAATTNATVIKATPGQIDQITAISTGVAVYYLKFYQKSTPPNCSTDPVLYTVPVPFATSGAGVTISFPAGLWFPTAGIAFCLTGAAADNDNTVAGTGVTISVSYR